MRVASAVSAILITGTLLAGCASHNGAAGTTAPPPVAKVGQAGVGDEQFVPPADAQWTIVCTQFEGYGHVERAKTLKQQLATQTGLPAFYVVHDEQVSTLYYGFYKQFRPSVDAAEGGRAQADLARIRSLKNGVGDPLFPVCGVTALEQPDPVAPADWNLLNVDHDKPAGDPTKAAYTLQIAIFKDSPERKQAAVDTVAAFRQQGIKNAYFYHGKTSSSVCIGTWPIDAVQQTEPERGSSDERLLVMPQNAPAGMADQVKDSEGNKIRAVSIQTKVVDPTLIDTQNQYPDLAVNGYNIKHTYKLKSGAGTVDRFEPSTVVFIPRADNTGPLGGGDQQNAFNGSPAGGAMDSGSAAPQSPTMDAGSHLRSLNQ